MTGKIRLKHTPAICKYSKSVEPFPTLSSPIMCICQNQFCTRHTHCSNNEQQPRKSNKTNPPDSSAVLSAQNYHLTFHFIIKYFCIYMYVKKIQDSLMNAVCNYVLYNVCERYQGQAKIIRLNVITFVACSEEKTRDSSVLE